ncbi:hypothetical protein [Bradyrhizobium sp. RDM4]|uniref:hypothetical protein n=1 Tax=Bradyrhizobium sp. RDM4 TaxID=3378765 RepID=UPI0038FBF4F1
MRTKVSLICFGLLFFHAGLSHAASTRSFERASEQKFWRDAMTEYYGPYNALQECWMTERNGTTACMSPHKLDVVESPTGRFLYAAVGGYRIDGGGGRENCHACKGVLGLLVFTEKHGKISLVAKNELYDDFGTWGHIPDPDAFSVRKVGPGRMGWLIQTDYLGTGHYTQETSIFAPIGDAVDLLGAVTTSYDDTAACDVRCSTYSFKLTFDTLTKSVAFFPLVLRGSGSRKGKRFRTTYRVTFDGSTLKYSIPKAFPK